MPTKVLDLEYERIPDRISGLDGYQQALVLIRIAGRPVERVYLPVLDGIISGSDLRSVIARNAGNAFWQYWFGEILSSPIEEHSNFHPPSATIAVCTRDRAEDLLHCLEAICRLFDSKQDILVVDSCSMNDATKRIVEKYPRVRYVREEHPGLNRARNRALREARHDIVAFLDDDAIPDKDWLYALTQNFFHPYVACVTGLTMPVELETPAQEYFEEHTPFSRGFERKVFEWNNTFHIGAGEVGAGTNMALRRSVLGKVGPFDEALDAGTPTRSGGDTEMFSRLLSAGYRIIYEPRALNWHRHRRSWKELRRTMYGYGVGVYSFWMRKLLIDKEWISVLVIAHWFLSSQLPRLIRSLFHIKNAPAFDIVSLEILGSFAGPWLFLLSRRQHSK